MKLYSLRRATFLSLILPLLLSLVLVAGSGLLSARSAIAVLRDHEMEQEAVFLQMLSVHEAAEGERLGVVRSTESFGLRALQAHGAGFRIWAGRMVMTSAGTLPAPGAAPPPPGFADLDDGTTRWRRYALGGGAEPLTVEIVEPAAVRMALAWRMARALVVPMLVLVLAVAVIATLRLTAAIRPIADLSHELDRRDSGDLQPLAGGRIPREVAPLVAAINDLMGRLGRAIAREREFADNAAHELRTPLAALKARAQATRQALGGDPAAQRSLAELDAAVDRTTGVIEQLLLLSRIDSQADGAAARRFAPVDLSRLAADVAREIAPAALAKGLDLAAEITPGLVLDGNADSLAILIRNLLDNAVRYTPPGGQVTIALDPGASGGAELRVADTGPGMSADQIARAFERFTRFDPDQPGSGLGLSIAKQVVAQHGGTIALTSPDEGGLVCTVRL
ncbi:ATP-binding protein [Novosphingobium bradum]|uniref:histidine kinase n=1 Tax=Novosphingobium bradum TaxID=1737444 RepID=A0ABV7IV87_9SPHN